MAALQEVRLLIEPLIVCVKGHIGYERSQGRCSVCRALESKKRQAKYGEKLREYARNYQKENKEAAKLRVQKFYERNPTYGAKQYARRKERLPGYDIQKSVEWAARNRERSRQIKSAWKKRNPHYAALWANKRRAAAINATPLWLTEEDHAQIAALYEEAHLFALHVDHIAPLVSDEVCGLHVPWNLRAVTPHENWSKNNKLDRSLLDS